MEKLQGMIDSFSSNQHQHYRAQLQAVQADMTLILRADPYAQAEDPTSRGGALEHGGEEIRSLVESMGAQLPNDEAAQRDYYALAGSRYREFVRQVNDCLEQRDANLTALHNNYTSSVNELDRLTQKKLHQAEEEHKALTNTIRQRLITSITKKRAQLLRDKEQLDVADSNALLLHPNHFSINNPGSPPNGIQNRKTRHLRHRAGSPYPGDLEPNGKKKRKAAALDDEGNESPAPAYKSLPPPPEALGGGRSPFKDARERNVYTQYEAPAYSLERIFTEKELAMATDTAKLATWRYFHQPQTQQQESGSTSNGTGVPSVDGEVVDAAEGEEGAINTTEGTNGTPPPGQPAEMERSTSHQVLTRGGARANPLAALLDLANTAASQPAPAIVSKDPFAPVVPTYHAVSRSEKSGAPAPSGVSHIDIENDFAMMRQSAARPAGGADADPEMLADAEDEESAQSIRRQLLDQALSNTGVSQPYRLPLMETGPAVIGKGVERIAGTGFAPVMSLEQRSLIKQAAQTGAPNAMAAALRAGGEPMSRTTSAGGVSEIGNEAPGPRRGRGRQMV
ncbi:hypothetical protein LTR37_016526 [Vermiconidia calcicola]|uniref:Uncharacterized protein n=1 Tax=Vermiconidia calcicola TaxID=1690605 RepID=A0ACC3MMR9_9PEZI|nr:hypothetical protein LTR37_016526 [Vermiconidia calcicola]